MHPYSLQPVIYSQTELRQKYCMTFFLEDLGVRLGSAKSERVAATLSNNKKYIIVVLSLYRIEFWQCFPLCL